MLRIRLAIVAIALSLCVGAQAQVALAEQSVGTQSVLFVCEHGSVKSLLARLLFERAAVRESLMVQAISRGTVPDADVPEWMRAALEQEGFNIGQWQPAALRESDLRSTQRVIAFDVSIPSSARSAAIVERWDGLPAVSEDYSKGRDAIAARVEELIKELKRPASDSLPNEK